LLYAVFNEAVSRYSTGEKAKGRDIIAALRTLKEIEGREPTESERAILRRFPGYGCVALPRPEDPAVQGRLGAARARAPGAADRR